MGLLLIKIDWGAASPSDITLRLPYKGKVDDWIKMPPGPPQGLVYHHEGSRTPAGSSAWGIANYHVNIQGWDHIGYHFIIERDGIVRQVLPLTVRSYHAGRFPGDDIDKFPIFDPVTGKAMTARERDQVYNDHYYSVCIVGNDPTNPQWESMVLLGIALRKAAFDIPGFKILGHRELPGKATECPGRGFSMDSLRRVITDRMEQMDKPGPGDEPWARAHGSWRGAAIAIKGACDAAVDMTREARDQVKVYAQQMRAMEKDMDDLVAKLTTIAGRD